MKLIEKWYDDAMRKFNGSYLEAGYDVLNKLVKRFTNLQKKYNELERAYKKVLGYWEMAREENKRLEKELEEAKAFNNTVKSLETENKALKLLLKDSLEALEKAERMPPKKEVIEKIVTVTKEVPVEVVKIEKVKEDGLRARVRDAIKNTAVRLDTKV